MGRAVWIEPSPTPESGPPLHPDPLLNALLARRVADPAAAADFVDRRPRPAPDPFALPGLGEAVDRIERAFADQETIAVFGDYDVDGVTATAVLVHALRRATGRAVLARLPTRAEGYGLNAAAISEFRQAGATLLIAVDCGSSDHVHSWLAHGIGLDLVVLDHHQMDGSVPEDAIVVLAQLRPDAPYRELTAAGLAYLLAAGLAQRGLDVGMGAGREPVELLDLAMLGTIGDVAPLLGVNRALVRDGLRQSAQRPRLGFRALAQRAAIDGANADQRAGCL